MELNKHYFRLSMYGDDYCKPHQEGKYIFFDPNYKIIFEHEWLPTLISRFITNNDLSEMELFFRLAGFSAFSPEELPDENPEIISFSSCRDDYLKGYNQEKAEKEIEEELGKGVISIYRKNKKARFARKRLQIIKLAEEYGLGVYDLERGRLGGYDQKKGR